MVFATPQPNNKISFAVDGIYTPGEATSKIQEELSNNQSDSEEDVDPSDFAEITEARTSQIPDSEQMLRPPE